MNYFFAIRGIFEKHSRRLWLEKITRQTPSGCLSELCVWMKKETFFNL